MKAGFVEIVLCSLSMSTVVFSQEGNVVNEGLFVRATGGYDNFSYSVTSVPMLEGDPRFTANIKGSFGFGFGIGYRSHGRGPVDGSIEIGLVSSRHEVGYQYQPSSSTVLKPVISTEPGSNENNDIALDALSIDLHIFFSTKSRLQPYLTAGFEFYLETINLRADPLKYFTFNPYDNSTQYYTFSFDNTYSGYGFHGGIGLEYYVLPNVVFDGMVHLSDRIFSLEDAGTSERTQFRSLNTELSGSILVVF